MNFLGIEVPVKNSPELDRGFIPLGKFFSAFLADAHEPLDIAVERAGGEVAAYRTYIHGTSELAEADRYYADRLGYLLRAELFVLFYDAAGFYIFIVIVDIFSCEMVFALKGFFS